MARFGRTLEFRALKTFVRFFFRGAALGIICAVPLIPLTGWLAAACCTRFVNDYSEIVAGFWLLGMVGGAFLGMVMGFWWAAPLQWSATSRDSTSLSGHSTKLPLSDWIGRAVFMVVVTAVSLASGALGAWLLGALARAGCASFFGLSDIPYQCQGFSLSIGVLGFLLASSMVIWGVTRSSS